MSAMAPRVPAGSWLSSRQRKGKSIASQKIDQKFCSSGAAAAIARAVDLVARRRAAQAFEAGPGPVAISRAARESPIRKREQVVGDRDVEAAALAREVAV